MLTDESNLIRSLRHVVAVFLSSIDTICLVRIVVSTVHIEGADFNSLLGGEALL